MVGNKINSVITIGNLNFPSPTAPSNRTRLYLSCFSKRNYRTYVINTDSHIKNDGCSTDKYIWKVNDIIYFFQQKSIFREINFWRRNLIRLASYFNAFKFIKKISNKSDKTIIIFFSTTFLTEFIYFFIAKFFKIPIIRECNEAPKHLLDNSYFGGFFYKRIRVKLYSGIIVISDFLEKYYGSFFKKNIYKIPILVDIERFKSNVELEIKSNEITYVGFMGDNKDGLTDLIKAIALTKKTIPEIKLNLIGSGPKSEIFKLKELVNSYKLNKNVIFFGTKPIEQIPKLLMSSGYLILVRPFNNTSNAGFPTKLGEYLCSKRPVIITNCGEVNKYLEDYKSAYFINYGADSEEISSTIINAINHSESEAIGKRGFQVAKSYFDYNLYIKNLDTLFKEIIS